MEVAQHGTGASTVVVVPGGPGLTNDAYVELIAGVAEFASVVTYQQRGTYPLAFDDYPKTMGEFADELSNAVDSARSQNRDRPIVVLGHSFGAAITIDALASGLSVDGAIVMGGFSSGGMIKAGVTERVASLPPEFHERYAGLSTDDADGLSTLIAEYWFPKHFCTIDPWPASLQNALGTLNGALLTHFLGANLLDLQGEVMNWDRSCDLASISVPVLVMGGHADYMTPDQARELSQAIPECELWLGEASSHCAWLEQPGETFARIRRFLTDRIIRPGASAGQV